MIREVLQLGIKGQDVVEGTLKRIQKEKEKFAQKAIAEFTPKKAAELAWMKEKKELTAPQRELATLKAAREAESERKVRKATEGPMRAAQGIGTLEGASAITSTLEGVATAVGGPIGMVAAKAGEIFINAGQAFKENVKSATVTFADTMDAQNRAMNIMGAGNAGFLRSQRVDIDVNSQRAIVEALGQKYGIVQDHLRQSIERIVGTGDRPTDITQAAALATGNFTALGTDKGFFMQKIADQFGAMPPSIRQELTSSLMDMIPSEDLFKQNDVLARKNTTAFNNMERERAEKMIGEYDKKTGQYANVQTAIDIQHLVNSMDTSLNRGMGMLAGKLDELIRTIIHMMPGTKAHA